MKKTAFMIGLFATTTVSSAALAGNTTYGYQTGTDNVLEIASDGTCNYTSVDQDGYWLDGDFNSSGICNNQVIGMVGHDSTAVTDIRGRDNVLGVAQNANHAYTEVSVTGINNGGAIYQHRSGSRVLTNVAGRNNTFVIRD